MSRRFYKNSVLLLFSEGASAGLMAFNGLLIARLLSVEDFGRFMAVWSLAQILGFAVDGGMGQVVARDLAQNQPVSLVPILFWRFAVIPAAALIAMGVSWRLFKGPQTPIWEAAVLTSGILLLGITDFSTWIFKGVQRIAWCAPAQLSGRALLLALCLAGWAAHWRSLPYVTVSYVAAGTAGALFSVFLIFRALGRPQGGKVLAVDFLRRLPALYKLGGILILAASFVRADTILVAHFCPATQVGLFSGAGRLIDVLRLLPTVLFGLFLPIFSSLRDRPAALAAKFKPVYHLSIACSAGLVLLGCRIAPMLFNGFLGSRYAGSLPYFVPWLWSSIFMTVNVLLFALLYAFHDHRRLGAGIGLALAADVVLNLLLLPHYGAIAAVWIRLGAESVNFAVLARGVLRRHLMSAGDLLGRPALAVGLAWLIFYGSWPVSPWMRTLLGCALQGILAGWTLRPWWTNVPEEAVPC